VEGVVDVMGGWWMVYWMIWWMVRRLRDFGEVRR